MVNFIIQEFEIITKFLNVTQDVLLLFVPVIIIIIFGVTKFEVIPNKIQSIFELIYEFLESQMRGLFKADEDYRYWMPFFLSIFLYVLLHNLAGLIPGGHSLTANILITGSLACLVILISIWMGIKNKGVLGFFVELTPSGIAWPIRVMLFPLELISLASRAFSLGVRLYANMFAGHLTILILLSLTELFKSIFFVPFDIVVITIMMLFELLIAFIQAYVFAYLSAIYITDTMYKGH
jgi:F-type H+-transporting ATPase subunit a